jgi:predicted MFS family arabinose efflux permease
MRSLPDALSVLQLRDFRLVLVGKSVSVLGDRMVSVALAFAVLEIGGSASSVGLVLAAASGPLVVTVLAGGVVADRLPRRSVMVAADLLRVATQATMAIVLLAGVAEVWMLAALAALTGVGTGFFNPASTALLPELVPPQQLQRANALRSTAVSAAEIAGPLAAGILVAAAGAGTAIAVDATTFAVSAVCLAALRLPPHRPRGGASFVSDLRDGWVAFSSRRWVWTFVVYFALGNMMWAGWSALGPVVADGELGGPGAWGAILAAVGVGALVGSVIAIHVDPNRPLVLVALMEGLFALPLAFLAGGANVTLLACGAFLSGAGMMVGMSVWESTLQRQIPGESLSRVSSYDWFGSFAFYPLGMALWGPLAAGVGVSTALWLAFGIFAALILALFAIPDTHRLRHTAEQS